RGEGGAEVIDKLEDVVMRFKPKSARAAAGTHGEKLIPSLGSRKGKLREASKNKFPAGVMAGDAQHDRAVLWTKYIGKNKNRLNASIREKGHGHFRKIDKKKIDSKPTDTNKNGWFVHVDVDGLSPGVVYEYKFRERSGQKSRTGR